MTKILTILQELLCIFGHVNLHVSLPSSPLLPTSHASVEFVLPVSRPSSVTLSLPIIPAPPLLHLNKISFRYLNMKHQTAFVCLCWPLSVFLTHCLVLSCSPSPAVATQYVAFPVGCGVLFAHAHLPH